MLRVLLCGFEVLTKITRIIQLERKYFLNKSESF